GMLHAASVHLSSGIRLSETDDAGILTRVSAVVPAFGVPRGADRIHPPSSRAGDSTCRALFERRHRRASLHSGLLLGEFEKNSQPGKSPQECAAEPLVYPAAPPAECPIRNDHWSPSWDPDQEVRGG